MCYRQGKLFADIPEYEDEVKGSVAIRRHRGLQNTGQEGTLLGTDFILTRK